MLLELPPDGAVIEILFKRHGRGTALLADAPLEIYPETEVAP